MLDPVSTELRRGTPLFEDLLALLIEAKFLHGEIARRLADALLLYEVFELGAICEQAGLLGLILPVTALQKLWRKLLLFGPQQRRALSRLRRGNADEAYRLNLADLVLALDLQRICGGEVHIVAYGLRLRDAAERQLAKDVANRNRDGVVGEPEEEVNRYVEDRDDEEEAGEFAYSYEEERGAKANFFGHRLDGALVAAAGVVAEIVADFEALVVVVRMVGNHMLPQINKRNLLVTILALTEVQIKLVGLAHAIVIRWRLQHSWLRRLIVIDLRLRRIGHRYVCLVHIYGFDLRRSPRICKVLVLYVVCLIAIMRLSIKRTSRVRGVLTTILHAEESKSQIS